MRPRVLIVGTSPYSTSGTSRTFDAYFHYWEKDRVAQIFSRNWVPSKGHCAELYQITDAQLLKRWLHRVKETGTIYYYDKLEEQRGIQEIKDTASVGKLYSFGTKHSPIVELLRRVLWKKKYWCTPKLDEWLDKFQPECVVYSFSNHVFFQQVALYVAKRYDIPIVTLIGDDFYFNDKHSLSPAYHLFRKLFKSLTEDILYRNASCALYCSNKIKVKYNEYFHINGQTVYNTSAIPRRDFRVINTFNPLIVYFGSIRLGRNESLLEIADALGMINPSYKLTVYSTETDPSYFEELVSHPNVIYGKAIPYSEVLKLCKQCDIYVIAEGFDPDNINLTRYSLSTKVPDSLACGASIFTYGPCESGVVGYLKDTKASLVCTEKKDLQNSLRSLIEDAKLQFSLYEQAEKAFKQNHQIESTTCLFEAIINDTIIAYKGGIIE